MWVVVQMSLCLKTASETNKLGISQIGMNRGQDCFLFWHLACRAPHRPRHHPVKQPSAIGLHYDNLQLRARPSATTELKLAGLILCRSWCQQARAQLAVLEKPAEQQWCGTTVQGSGFCLQVLMWLICLLVPTSSLSRDPAGLGHLDGKTLWELDISLVCLSWMSKAASNIIEAILTSGILLQACSGNFNTEHLIGHGINTYIVMEK